MKERTAIPLLVWAVAKCNNIIIGGAKFTAVVILIMPPHGPSVVANTDVFYIPRMLDAFNAGVYKQFSFRRTRVVTF